MLHEDRRRAESFGAEAERYDRSRPTYPAELINDVLGPSPEGISVLDVGCGTGIAARLMIERGAAVLGLEPDERMADLARRRGVDVEIDMFESWDPAGRVFDRVTAGQSWHWIDPVAGADKAGSLLRSGGKVCVFWNIAEMPADVDSAVADVYRRVAPGIDDYSTLVGHSRTDTSLFKARYRAPLDGFTASKELTDPTLERFVWRRTYTRDEWLDQLPTHSDHAAMAPPDLDRLLEEVGRVIDRYGGAFEMSYHTWLISASRH